MKEIPKKLKKLPQWVVWKEVKNKDGKVRKPPHQVKNGQLADKTDPSHWATFEEAMDAYLDKNNGYAGIGFCFTENDPFGFIDLDNCIEDGALVNGAAGLVKEFSSYTEITPSGNGLHIIIEGSVPRGKRKENIEIYTSDAYATFTGNHLPGTPKKIHKRQKQLDKLHSKLSGKSVDGSKTPILQKTAIDLGLIFKARGGSSGKLFSHLFDKGVEGTDYSSQSEADLALCNILASYTTNPVEIDRVFRQSALYRKKWERRDYREDTIAKALKNSTGEDADLTIEEVGNLMGKYKVTKKLVNDIEDAVFLVPGQVVRSHVHAICAKSGWGKTTIIFYDWAPQMVQAGYQVFYADMDSPAEAVKKMHQFADKQGITYIKPELTRGNSIEGFLKDIDQISKSSADIRNFVFVFDTMKKFVDLMSKTKAKDFFKMTRRLSERGATVILPGHANKHLNKEGDMVFEGVGDVRNDSDNLIYLYAVEQEDKSLMVTAYPDKTRAKLKKKSYQITKNRKVFPQDEVVDTRTVSTAKIQGTQDILWAISKAIKKGIQTQTSIVQWVMEETGFGRDKITKVLQVYSANDFPGQRFEAQQGEKNRINYKIRKQKK